MIVVRMIVIQTFMILYPPVASHSRPPIARLGLLLCFQPDGSVLGVSENNEEAADPFIRFHLTLWYRSSSATLYTDGSRCARLGLTHSSGRPFLLSPSCRAIVQVEKRSLRSRCLMPFFGVKPPPPPCSRRPHRTLLCTALAIVQGGIVQVETLSMRSWFSMLSLASDPAVAELSSSTHRTFVPLSPSCRAIVQVATRSLYAHGSRRSSLASGRRHRCALTVHIGR